MRRVVITGMGMISCLGHSVKESWESLINGQCGIGALTRFDAQEYSTRIAGQVKDFNVANHFDPKEARKMADFTQYAMAGAVEAMKDAGLEKDSLNQERFGCILGNGIGGLDLIEEDHRKLFERGPRAVHPMIIPKIIANEAPGNIAIHFGLKGPCNAVVTACASASDALGAAYNAIRVGMADQIISGGCEMCITRIAIAGFNRIHALSTHYNDSPQTASRPFDKDRDGFVMGEGAGILILEELESAKKRCARIYAELTGYGASCDAGHLTAPDPEGSGAARAFSQALQDAGLNPEDIDYINAHGTSTPTNDPIETRAIKTAFGNHAKNLKISSTKGATAHCIGAAGGIEAIFSIKAINEGIIPPTINLENPDPECDLDYVPNTAQEKKVHAAISDSLGFGGHNAVLVFQEYKN